MIDRIIKALDDDQFQRDVDSAFGYLSWAGFIAAALMLFGGVA